MYIYIYIYQVLVCLALDLAGVHAALVLQEAQVHEEAQEDDVFEASPLMLPSNPRIVRAAQANWTLLAYINKTQIG